MMKKHVLMLLVACLTMQVWAVDPTEVEISDVWKKYYPALNSWSIVMTTAASEDVRYVLDVEAPATMAENAQYTATGGWQNMETGDYVAVTSGKYTEYTMSNGDFCEQAQVTLANGETHLAKHIVKGMPVATDTIHVVLPVSKLSDASTSLGDPVVVFRGAENGYDVSLSFYGSVLKSEYTNADSYDYYTHLITPTGRKVVRDVHATASQNRKGFHLDAYVLCEDAICYHTELSYTLPDPKGYVDVVATNMLIDESKINQLGEIVYSASNTDYIVELWINTMSVVGTYAGKAIDLDYSFVSTNGFTMKTMAVLDAEVTISKVDNVTTLVGEVLADDTICYRVNLSYVRPTEPSRELTVSIEDAMLDLDRLSQEGVLSMVGISTDLVYNLSMVAYVGSDIEGHYTEHQLDLYETYMRANADDEIYDLLEADLTVKLDPENDLLIVSGTLFMQGENNPADAPLVHLNMSATCISGRPLDNSEENFYGYMQRWEVDTTIFDETGIVTLDAMNSDSTQMLAAAFYTMNVDPVIGIPAGIYTISDSQLPWTVAIAPDPVEGQLFPSFAANCKEKGQPVAPLWYLMDGEIVVENHDGKLYCEVHAYNSFKKQIQVFVNPSVADTIEIDMNDCELANYTEEGKFQFLGQSTIWEAFVAIEKPLAAGHYTWADAIHDYCHVKKGASSYLTAVDLEAEVREARNGYDCEAYLTCSDNHCYHIVFHYYWDEPVAEPFETRDVVMHNLRYDDVWEAEGFALYEASNDSISLQITFSIGAGYGSGDVITTEDLNHEFTYFVNSATGSVLRTYGGELTVAYTDTPNSYMVIEGYLIGKDGVKYMLHMNNSPEGVENVQTAMPEARKYLMDGQLIIDMNGVKYNVLGARL